MASAVLYDWELLPPIDALYTLNLLHRLKGRLIIEELESWGVIFTQKQSHLETRTE